MSLPAGMADRLTFLARVVEREARYLRQTDERLFGEAFDATRAASLRDDADLAERVDAFVSRFSRLQDTLGEKLIPALLRALDEPPLPMLDALDRAEKLGWLASADGWLSLRRLRNQMVHEYIEDAAVFIDALNTAH